MVLTRYQILILSMIANLNSTASMSHRITSTVAVFDTSESHAVQALHLNGTVLGDYPLKVLPSKTAIVPVNTQYLPKTTTEREKCSRTIYAANIDKKVDRESVKLFFETICGGGSQPVVLLRENFWSFMFLLYIYLVCLL